MAKLSAAAGHVDLKERRFRQLIQAGVFQRPKASGGYDLDRCALRKAIARLRFGGER